MNKRIQLFGLAVWLLLMGGAISVALGHEESAAMNPYCPVSPEEPVDPTIHVEYEGRTVYLCCNRCRTKFLADPEAYLENLPPIASEPVADHAHPAEEAEAPHDHAHDHATDHGVASGGAKAAKYLGKFHPLAVHFPIALILTALLAEGFFIWRKAPLYAAMSRFTITLGALGALLTAPLGWMSAAFAQYPASMASTLFLHRWFGVAAASTAVVAAVLVWVADRRPERKWRVAYQVCLLLSAVAVCAAAHFGASLIYGTDYFVWQP